MSYRTHTPEEQRVSEPKILLLLDLASRSKSATNGNIRKNGEPSAVDDGSLDSDQEWQTFPAANTSEVH